jgi:hypothetical protein
MASLAEQNIYLRDPEARRRMLEEDARQSSLFEGARGLKVPTAQSEADKRRSMVSRKKAVKAE